MGSDINLVFIHIVFLNVGIIQLLCSHKWGVRPMNYKEKKLERKMRYQWKACHTFGENTFQSYLSSWNPLVFHFHKCEQWDEMDNKQYILWNIDEWWSYQRWRRSHKIIPTVIYRRIQLILSNVFFLDVYQNPTSARYSHLHHEWWVGRYVFGKHVGTLWWRKH